jgi:membrane protein YqaA with SNARE-associated domain
MFRHLGALGLFLLAILDSSPLPTFGGPDILTAILAASHRDPWYEYAAVATAGSVIGAYLTFRLARRAGSAYLHSKFGHRKLDVILRYFDR